MSRQCGVEGCDRPHAALDLCNAHYQQKHVMGMDPQSIGATRGRRRLPLGPTVLGDRLYEITRKYNISPEWIASQAELGCGICGVMMTVGGQDGYHVDHDHGCCSGPRSCGKCVRGLLCAPCNKGLGNFTDDVVKLKKAIEYLNRAAARDERS